MNPLLSFLKPDHPDTPPSHRPHLDRVVPSAAMPGGEVQLHGANLAPLATELPRATLSGIPAHVTLARPTQANIHIPEASVSGDLLIHRGDESSNPVYLRVAVPMAENLHPVANPVVDPIGNIFTTLSGSRGQQVPVSIFQIQRDFQIRPFVRGLLNPTSLAFGPDGLLYASSRAEGTVYRIASDGSFTTYAEGLGIATGIAFDPNGNLYVGDRSGTIFKIDPDQQIFVHATLPPSMAAYHLAFNAAGTLFVTGPTTSSHQVIHAVDPDGNTSIFFRGLGRAQGMAFDVDDNLYIAASLNGQRGIVRITPANPAAGLHPQPSLILAANNLVGLAFLEDGCATLATRDALYHIDLGIQGRSLL